MTFAWLDDTNQELGKDDFMVVRRQVLCQRRIELGDEHVETLLRIALLCVHELLHDVILFGDGLEGFPQLQKAGMSMTALLLFAT